MFLFCLAQCFLVFFLKFFHSLSNARPSFCARPRFSQNFTVPSPPCFTSLFRRRGFYEQSPAYPSSITVYVESAFRRMVDPNPFAAVTVVINVTPPVVDVVPPAASAVSAASDDQRPPEPTKTKSDKFGDMLRWWSTTEALSAQMALCTVA